ncbi:FHA domain-containing protein [Brevibacterium sp. p3-SID960]|uniref:FHA domain-containing protein n=1 Tax=Brevibacterium sp. p3-SID960 TaxID=2916063 RepID=UPI0037C13C33
MSQQNYPQDEAGQTPWYGGDDSAREPRAFPYQTGETPTDPSQNQGGSHAAGEQIAAAAPQRQGYNAQQYGSGPAAQPQYGSQPPYGGQPEYDADSQPQQQYGSQPYEPQQQYGQQSYEPQQQGGQPAYGSQPQQGYPQQYDSGAQPQYSSEPQYGSQPQGSQPEAGTQASPNAYGNQPVGGHDQQVPSILDPRTGEIHPVSDLNHLQETDALLVVVSGPDAGAQILLDTDVVTVGRSPNADIFLDDVTVSRKHAEFVRTPSGFTLRDTGSLNGTYVGRQLIDSIELQNGADVQIGKFRMIFQQRPLSS